MSTLTSLISGGGGGGGINSVQRIFTSLYYAGSSFGNSIAAVDTSKTFLSIGGWSDSGRNVACQLTSSSNVQMYLNTQSISSPVGYAAVEVVEYA
jgi:hypothetical protein